MKRFYTRPRDLFNPSLSYRQIFLAEMWKVFGKSLGIQRSNFNFLKIGNWEKIHFEKIKFVGESLKRKKHLFRNLK
jgi:hypothetical protein